VGIQEPRWPRHCSWNDDGWMDMYACLCVCRGLDLGGSGGRFPPKFEMEGMEPHIIPSTNFIKRNI